MGVKSDIITGAGLDGELDEKREAAVPSKDKRPGQESHKSPTDVSDEALLRGWPLYTMMLSVVSAVLLVALAGTILGTVRQPLSFTDHELIEV